MNTAFIELTVVFDSSDTQVTNDKGSFSPSQIASFIPMNSQTVGRGEKTKVTLFEPEDYVNDEDDSGGVVRSLRTLYVADSYDNVKKMLINANK